MKHAKWIVCLAVLAVSGGDAWAQDDAAHLAMLRELAGTDEARCASVTVSPPFEFHGKWLNEIPDIHEPELRLANELMSNGCFSRAFEKLDGVLKNDPGNQNAIYIIARMTWMKMGHEAAEQRVTRALAGSREFPSAVVMLAGIRYAEKQNEEAAKLLDSVEQKSPTDLWIFMNRLRLEAANSPTADLRARLVEIVRSKAFPPNAREIAADTASELPNQSAAEKVEVLRLRMDIESSFGAGCKAVELAGWLGDRQGRFADVIELLESPRVKQGKCRDLEVNRTMLAQAYLMEAIKINPRRVPENQKLYDQAMRLVDGNAGRIVEHAQRYNPFNVTKLVTIMMRTP
jgi:tetratricopeptide (TPR) repeat protein